MIAIDFVAGSHGHYLEYVANRFLAHTSADFDPFNANQASHTRPPNYYDTAVFVAEHYYEKGIPNTPHIVRITYTESDLLALSSVSLRRAGDYNIDNNQLEIDTYHKLKNIDYEHLIDTINRAYPDVELSEQNPHCPRHVLREYFKFGFQHPQQHGFMQELNKLMYKTNKDVFDFPMSNFYNQDKFVSRVLALSKWYNNHQLDLQELIAVHKKFLDKQIYKNHHEICDKIIQAVCDAVEMPVPDLTLFQESYINGKLEAMFGTELPFLKNPYFTNTKEIIQCLNVSKQ